MVCGWPPRQPQPREPSSEGRQDLEQRRGDLLRRFLLDPVAGAVDDGAGAEVGAVVGDIGVGVEIRDEAAHGVLGAGDEAAWLRERRGAHLGESGEIPVLIAVAAQRATKAAGLEIGGEVIEIFRRLPRRKGSRIDEGLQERATPRPIGEPPSRLSGSSAGGEKPGRATRSAPEHRNGMGLDSSRLVVAPERS